MQWNDINIEDDLGKEAAKTIMALDYYLDAAHGNEEDTTFNADLVNFDINETNKTVQKVQPKYHKSVFSPEIPDGYRTMNSSFIKKVIPSKNL